MENFTFEEEKAISELRSRMKNELPCEIYEDKILIYKFLKARNFNLKQSESMLRKNLQFRKIMQTDTILKDFKASEVLEKHVSQSLIGFDKEGSPIYYIGLGSSDGKGLFKSSNGYYVLKHVLQALETNVELHKQQSQKLERKVSQSVFIYNMDKLTFAQATHKPSLQHFMRGAMIFQDNYPEMLKRVYIINASVYFTVGYSVVKTILSSGLIDKIRVYGQNGWKEELLRTIDSDVLPAFLGGSRTDPDGNELCLTFINHGGIVPESYYLVKDIEKTAKKPGMKHIRLERQSSTSIPVHIEIYNSILNWEFETKCHDIGFGLTVESPHEEVIPVEKFETELEPLCGMYRCNRAGEYNIVFDNSYSWLHHKDIYYRTWVTDADDK